MFMLNWVVGYKIICMFNAFFTSIFNYYTDIANIQYNSPGNCTIFAFEGDAENLQCYYSGGSTAMARSYHWFFNGINRICDLRSNCNTTLSNGIITNTDIIGNTTFSTLNIISANTLFHNTTIQCGVQLDSGPLILSKIVTMFLHGKYMIHMLR